jgi:hypothetical protein
MPNPDAIQQLQAALDTLASALESGQPDAVLAAELPLAAAAGAFSGLDKANLARNPQAPSALLDLRLAVARCRAMARAASDLGTVVQGHAAYSRSGARPMRLARSFTVASLT